METDFRFKESRELDLQTSLRKACLYGLGRSGGASASLRVMLASRLFGGLQAS